MFIFADDIILAKTYNLLCDAESCLNRPTDLKTISEWAEKWMVSFNFEKKRFLSIFLLRKNKPTLPKLSSTGFT